MYNAESEAIWAAHSEQWINSGAEHNRPVLGQTPPGRLGPRAACHHRACCCRSTRWQSAPAIPANERPLTDGRAL